MNYTLIYSLAWICLLATICGSAFLIYQAMQNDYNLRTQCVEKGGMTVAYVGCIVDKQAVQ